VKLLCTRNTSIFYRANSIELTIEQEKKRIIKLLKAETNTDNVLNPLHYSNNDSNNEAGVLLRLRATRTRSYSIRDRKTTHDVMIVVCSRLRCLNAVRNAINIWTPILAKFLKHTLFFPFITFCSSSSNILISLFFSFILFPFPTSRLCHEVHSWIYVLIYQDATEWYE